MPGRWEAAWSHVGRRAWCTCRRVGDVGSPGTGLRTAQGRNESRRALLWENATTHPSSSKGRPGLSGSIAAETGRVRSSAQQTNTVCFPQAGKMGFRCQRRLGALGGPPRRAVGARVRGALCSGGDAGRLQREGTDCDVELCTCHVTQLRFYPGGSRRSLCLPQTVGFSGRGPARCVDPVLTSLLQASSSEGRVTGPTCCGWADYRSGRGVLPPLPCLPRPGTGGDAQGVGPHAPWFF